MKNNYNFTFIICYRHREDRFKPLIRVLDWINSFSGAEVILVEQDKHSKIGNMNLDCKHIFIQSNELFNKSWGFNVGLKYASTDIVIFSDTDIIMQPDKFIEGIKTLENYDMVSPYNSVVDLEQNESFLPMTEILKIKKIGRGENDIQKINICGGIAMYNKSAIEKIQGWNEVFVGWGAEDDFQSLKTKTFLKYKELEGRCYHLWHVRGLENKDAYMRNLDIWNKYNSMTGDELGRNIKTFENKGLKNKYQD